MKKILFIAIVLITSLVSYLAYSPIYSFLESKLIYFINSWNIRIDTMYANISDDSLYRIIPPLKFNLPNIWFSNIYIVLVFFLIIFIYLIALDKLEKSSRKNQHSKCNKGHI